MTRDDWPSPQNIADELRNREATARGRYGNAPLSEWPESRPAPRRHYSKRKTKSEPTSE